MLTALISALDGSGSASSGGGGGIGGGVGISNGVGLTRRCDDVGFGFGGCCHFGFGCSDNKRASLSSTEQGDRPLLLAPNDIELDISSRKLNEALGNHLDNLRRKLWDLP